MRHFPTHEPFNIHCDACNLGKMRKAKKFVGSYQESRQPKGWLDLVTADHLVAKMTVWRESRATLMLS